MVLCLNLIFVLNLKHQLIMKLIKENKSEFRFAVKLLLITVISLVATLFI
jgi:hypothetical protein